MEPKNQKTFYSFALLYAAIINYSMKGLLRKLNREYTFLTIKTQICFYMIRNVDEITSRFVKVHRGRTRNFTENYKENE